MRALAIAAIAAGGCGRFNFDVGGQGDARDGDVVSTGDVARGPQPIAWWKLDEGSGVMVADAIGNDDGVFGGEVNPTWVAGELGGALELTDALSIVELNTPPNLANLAAVSVSAWLNPMSLPAADGEPHCVFDHAEVGAGWVVDTSHEASGDFDLQVLEGSDQVFHAATGGVLQVGTWTHVVLTWDGGQLASGVRLYADGSEVVYNTATVSDSMTPRPDESTITVAIGCDASTGFPGAIDDVKIYDRVLTPAEVAAL